MADDMKRTLLFVYNADRGMFNTLSDMAHKVFSPKTYACNLCAITHSTFSMRDEWKVFLETLDQEMEFQHRNEFREAYPGDDTALPAIFLKKGDELERLVEAEAIDACDSMEALKSLISQRLADEGGS